MIMAVASSSTTTSLEAMDATPPVSTSEAAATDMSSSAPVSCAIGASDLCDPSNSSREARRDGEIQNAASLRSEEYRQLFRLPPEEVLVEDFNCACQENILVQGHMYLFVHYICFYSNIFGFETKKIIHFRDITSVKRAKTAGIFPNAIEIVAGGKKYFFASFLSRDEAFKLINDGWMQHGSDSRAVMDKQESLSESSFLENGSESDSVRSSKRFDDMEISDRSENVPVSIDLVVSHTEDDNAAATLPDLGENEEHNAEPTLISGYPSSAAIWKVEDYDAPKVQECQTKVAESKFPVKVEEFFNLFFSDNAVEFLESFHRRCGDKEFKCSPWRLDDQFGHTREVSFQHPIKIYFGARFGSCQEMQKFRVYRNSHLVVEKSQEINDVPYGDYFRVEGLWDVRRGGDKLEEQCCLSVYVNVAFVKKTMFKGKIVQSTLEECREAYAIWVDMAHELLKERNLEKREKSPQSNMIQNGEVSLEANQDTGHPVQESSEPDNSRRMPKMLDPMDADKHEASLFPGNWINGVSVSLSPMIRETLVRSWGRMKSQTHLPQLVAITFAVILLMQFSIVLLLTRPQNIQIISQADYIGGSGSGVGEKSSEAIAWLEKRLYHLKDEMSMVESRLERMRWEHAQLKEQLRDLEHFHNHGK